MKKLFDRARRAERGYARALRRVARTIGDIVEAFPPDRDGTYSEQQSARIEETLTQYADMITDWAEAAANRMLAEAQSRNRGAWIEVSREIGLALREELAAGETGRVMRRSLAEQVGLIKSLPLEAAKRVHELALEGRVNGTRARELADEIQNTRGVTENRALLIARTETSRVATELVKARAQSVGSVEFIWRTSGDSDVRPSHKALNGTTHRWDAPPVCDPPNHRALPGGIWNCRCWAEPIIPEV